MGSGILLLFFLVLVLRPKSTPCHAQDAIAKDRLRGLLYADPKKPDSTPLIKNHIQLCEAQGDLGGCADYLSDLRRVTDEMSSLADVCGSTYEPPKELLDALTVGLEVMAKLAWGESAPQAYVDRVSWFDGVQTQTYCDMKTLYVRSRGKQAWRRLVDDVLDRLPGRDAMVSKDEALKYSLFSLPCGPSAE